MEWLRVVLSFVYLFLPCSLSVLDSWPLFYNRSGLNLHSSDRVMLMMGQPILLLTGLRDAALLTACSTFAATMLAVLWTLSCPHSC